jgi:hypothetical protein
VLVYAGASALALMGCVAFYYAWFKNAPAGAAILLKTIGMTCLGLAGGIVLCRWILGYLIDD